MFQREPARDAPPQNRPGNGTQLAGPAPAQAPDPQPFRLENQNPRFLLVRRSMRAKALEEKQNLKSTDFTGAALVGIEEAPVRPLPPQGRRPSDPRPPRVQVQDSGA